ncbi:aldo/keto reductase [Oceanomicrobium pacificus]|uniref:Aldo/keto reductase n=1 Tax=Oceanomicrobium pacificus TaxID=2692916 RepID=A0A6B0TJ31_9RHOB|nr:aldo/keto reductase [Oceanomicrobium pacificus]MXU64387.1 aldo/keto reductase [Oceanomicrobium pacificus]
MRIPTIRLNDGVDIPALGFGTWQLPDNRVPDVIGCALEEGYRHFDTAHAYLNEASLGAYLRDCGVPRDQLFVTSKLWNDRHGYDRALENFDATMERLGFETLDLYLIHWPVPMEDLYVDSWKAMIRLRDEGRIRSIGVSNFEPEHLTRLIGETGVAPSLNQIELHPNFQQRDVRDFHRDNGIAIESWSPLGQGHMMQDPILTDIAAKHGVTAAKVILRWHLQQGLVAIPRSKTPANIAANRDIFGFELDADDMDRIATLDKGAEGRIGPHPQELGPVALPTKS